MREHRRKPRRSNVESFFNKPPIKIIPIERISTMMTRTLPLLAVPAMTTTMTTTTTMMMMATMTTTSLATTPTMATGRTATMGTIPTRRQHRHRLLDHEDTRDSSASDRQAWINRSPSRRR